MFAAVGAREAWEAEDQSERADVLHFWLLLRKVAVGGQMLSAADDERLLLNRLSFLGLCNKARLNLRRGLCSDSELSRRRTQGGLLQRAGGGCRTRRL
jgi:hypothetical protein